MIVTRVSIIPPTTVYRRTMKSNERYMEERLWQRALRRLDSPQPEPTPAANRKKKGKRSFRSVLGVIGKGLGRYVDIEV
jgi:hypothetical protein